MNGEDTSGRRAALRVLALTATAWHLRGTAGTETVPALRIGFQKGSPNPAPIRVADAVAPLGRSLALAR